MYSEMNVAAELVSPKQVSRAIGVSESTVKRWCDRGLIPTAKTAGGHRRLRSQDVVSFVTERGFALQSPQLLGLPVNLGHRASTAATAQQTFQLALVNNDRPVARQTLMDLLVGGHTVTSICDDVIARTFHQIGDLWECGDVHVYQERRSCEICLQLLHELQQTLPAAAAAAPLAIGGTIAGDVYNLPVTMAGLVLSSLNWQTNLLGTNLPVDTLVQAVADLQPRLMWLSVSHIASEFSFAGDIATLFRAVDSCGGALVLGGRAVTRALRSQITVHCFGEDFRTLEMFARSIHRVGSDPTPPRGTGESLSSPN